MGSNVPGSQELTGGVHGEATEFIGPRADANM
jgi:hypothetical protein